MRQAVILAAGEGQRLRPFTINKPKVMLSIAGKPILQYVIEALAQNGIRDIVVVAGYCREQVFDYFGAGEQLGVDIVYVTQSRQLGTAHALAQVKDIVKDDFLLLPGDNLIEAATIADVAAAKPNTILVKKADDTTRYGVVAVEKGMVRGIEEKPREAESNLVNTGIYAFSPEVFDFIGEELDIPDVINKMIAQGCVVKAKETGATWLDIAYPWDILGLNDAILRKLPASVAGTVEAGVALKGLVSVGKDSVIRSNSYIVGPVIIGENCDIGPNVCLLPSSSIGNNVVISPFSQIENSVIGDDVSIGAGSIVQDSVIAEGCVIQGRFAATSGDAEVKINDGYHPVRVGAMLGVGCTVGHGVVANPGVIIGNYSQIQPMKLVSGKLADRSLVV